MKIRVLTDNNTYIDRYYFGEPGLSFFIEIDGNKILFDTGYSDVFMLNALKMGIDLDKITHIVLSHGHNDHTRGLKFLNGAMDLKSIELIAHPKCFNEKSEDNSNIGSPLDIDEIRKITKFNPQSGVHHISDNCIFLGQIPQRNNFETRQVIGQIKDNEQWKDDYVFEDTALVCKTQNGLFIITGCSHSGICNIVSYAMDVCNNKKIAGIIGGFHLFDVDDRLKKTVEYFEQLNIPQVYPCHCVSLKVKAEMTRRLNVEEVGVGLSIEV